MKRKLRLELDQLAVESFETRAAAPARGTVHAASGIPGGYECDTNRTCPGGTTCRGTETSDSLSVELLCVCTGVGYDGC